MYQVENEKEQITDEKKVNKGSSNFYAVVSYVSYNGKSCFYLCGGIGDG